jgi:acetyl-CoA C-acetyltransferase
MSISGRTPVIIGVGQVTSRPQASDTYATRPTPLTLMTEALERAALDTGTADVLLHLDELVAIGSFTWHPRDPALLVAESLGITTRTRLTPTGGNIPQKLVHESARRILSGELDAIAVVGSEAMSASAMARREGVPTNWPTQDDSVAKPELVEEDRIPFTADEYANGLTLPVEVYPLFENARRARLNLTIEEQRRRISELWANFALVARDNPYAWITSAPSAETIGTPSESNRMVAFPYMKMLVANLPVDMGASYIMTSYEKALAFGVSRDKMIFPQAGSDATDHWFVSERPQLDASPAMQNIWKSLQGFGESSDTFTHMDLYSCFPTVVQTAGDVLGIDVFDAERIPTVTGGLTFGGGPGNNYVTHSICSTVDALRENPDGRGLVTGLGWFSTKHAWGTYRAAPPEVPFQWRGAQRDVESLPKCALRQDDGGVTIESYTVTHGRNGQAEKLIVAGRFASGERVWSHSLDTSLCELAESEDILGRSGVVREGSFYL